MKIHFKQTEYMKQSTCGRSLDEIEHSTNIKNVTCKDCLSTIWRIHSELSNLALEKYYESIE